MRLNQAAICPKGFNDVQPENEPKTADICLCH